METSGDKASATVAPPPDNGIFRGDSSLRGVTPAWRRASRVLGDEALQHVDEARGRTIGADALQADAGALAHQEHLVGQQLRLPEPRVAAEAHELLPVQRFLLVDEAPRRVLRVGQF